MDSNGTRFLLLAQASDFASNQTDLAWDPLAGSFGLVQRQNLRLPRAPLASALAAWEAAEPLVLDDHGQFGRLSADRTRFLSSPSWPASEWRPVLAGAEGLSAIDTESLSLDPVDAPGGARFADLHLGGDGLAALPYSDAASEHGLIVIHLRLRWQARCTLPQQPTRAWVDGRNRIWILSDSSLMSCEGGPLPHPYRPRPDRFEPLAPNPNPLRLRRIIPLPDNDGMLGLTADREGVYMLARLDDPETGAAGQAVFVHRFQDPVDTPCRVYPIDGALPFATDIAPVEGGRIALLAPRDPVDAGFRDRDCPVVVLDDDPELVGRTILERYPQRSLAAVRFVRALDGKTRYLADDRPRELHRLAQARFPQEARGVLLHRLDSGQPDTLWHRLILEACIPAGCRVLIEARVCDEWDRRAAAGWDVQRPPAWLPRPSELPWDRGRLQPIPGRQGIFEVLLQRPNGETRELRGRYLELALTLSGDGRHSPRIRAIRVWFPRFSWQQAYLPQHFHQQEPPLAATPDPAISPQPANGADVRERMLSAFEGLLTPIEDRIAASEVLLDPDAAPLWQLPVLARMLGSDLPAQWPEARRRDWLTNTGGLQRGRGTLAGLRLALDVATDGGVRRGSVVAVEGYRLRRTLATVLGIEMSDQDHPLTLGTAQSGNSIVGQSLILTDEDARELLALFAPELAKTRADQRAVDDFFDRYARRLTVVLHGEAATSRRAVEEVLSRHTPATVRWVIRETDHPFVLGLSPLLGIDSFLETRPPFGRTVLGSTRLGGGDLLRNPRALSPEHVTATEVSE